MQLTKSVFQAKNIGTLMIITIRPGKAVKNTPLISTLYCYYWVAFKSIEASYVFVTIHPEMDPISVQ